MKVEKEKENAVGTDTGADTDSENKETLRITAP